MWTLFTITGVATDWGRVVGLSFAILGVAIGWGRVVGASFTVWPGVSLAILGLQLAGGGWWGHHSPLQGLQLAVGGIIHHLNGFGRQGVPTRGVTISLLEPTRPAL